MNIIKLIRQRENMTQDDFCKKMGCNQSVLSRIENKFLRPTTGQLSKLYAKNIITMDDIDKIFKCYKRTKR